MKGNKMTVEQKFFIKVSNWDALDICNDTFLYEISIVLHENIQ